MPCSRVGELLLFHATTSRTLQLLLESRRPLGQHSSQARHKDSSARAEKEASLANPNCDAALLEPRRIAGGTSRDAPSRDEIARPNNTQVTPVLAAAQGFEL